MVAKLNFQQPLLQSSVSHGPSEIILICSYGAHEMIFINSIENRFFFFFFFKWLNIFVIHSFIEQRILSCRILCCMECSKEQHLFEIICYLCVFL